MAFRHSSDLFKRFLTPKYLARLGARSSLLAVIGTCLGLAAVPSRLVVEARGTVQVSPGNDVGSGVAIAAPFDGTILSIRFRTGDTVPTGSVVLVMDTRVLVETRERFEADWAAALADLAVAQERLAAAHADAELERTRAEQRADVARAEARLNEGARDPLLIEQLRHERDAVEAAKVAAASRSRRLQELHVLGAVSERAVRDAEAEAARFDAQYRAANAALERVVLPASETVAAPAMREAEAAEMTAAAVGVAGTANVEAARRSVEAARARVDVIETALRRIEGELARAEVKAPRGGAWEILPHVEDGIGVREGQPVGVIRSTASRAIQAEIPEWGYEAFTRGSDVVVRPEAADHLTIPGKVEFRGYIVVEKQMPLGIERFAPARVSFDEAPVPLPPGSTVTVEATYARGPLIWVAPHVVTAKKGARFAIGW